MRRPLPDHLPRETVVHEPAAVCGCCDRAKLARLGEDVTEVLEKVPARLKVIRHVRPRYACRVCEGVFQAPAPDLPIERGRPGPGLIAHVAVSKYCDGLPLFRQSVILAFRREGVEIDRATLADWIGRAAWWLAPLARLIGTTVMTQEVLHTDDTPIRTLAPGTGKTRLSRFWVYAVDPQAPCRAWRARGVLPLLARPQGRAPARPPGRVQRRHARRRVRRLRRPVSDPAGQARPHPARRLLGACPPEAVRGARSHEVAHRRGGAPAHPGALRDRGRDQLAGQPHERQAERQARSKPLLADLKAWMEAQRRRASGKTVLGKALQYALGRWEALARYADDGRLAIDNNVAERLMRGIAISRKNFLFVGSDKGGERAATLYTLIETAKLNGLDPEAYLAHVIDQLAHGHLATRLSELLPCNCKDALAAKAA